MASFQLQRNDNNEIININVGSAYLRDNNAVTRNQYKVITDFNPQAFLYINSIGDRIFNKLDVELIESGVIYTFTNLPEWTIQKYGNGSYPYLTSAIYYNDPTQPAVSGTYTSNSYYYGNIYICYNKTGIFQLPYYKFDSVKNSQIINPTKTPWILNASNAAYGRICDYTILFDESNGDIYFYNPFYFTMAGAPYYNGSTSISQVESSGRSYNFSWISHYYEDIRPFRLGTTTNTAIINLENNIQLDTSQLVGTLAVDSITPTISNSYMSTVFAKNSSIPQIQGLGGGTINFAYGNGVDIRADKTYLNTFELFYHLLNDKQNLGINPYPPDNPTDNNTPSPPFLGGNGNTDKTSDDINFPELPQIHHSINIYALNNAMIDNLINYLWSSSFSDTILKVLTNPFDVILSMYAITANIPINGTQPIQLGNVTSSINANVVNSHLLTLDFGELIINEYYNDISDYNSVIQLYLPFHSYITLNTLEVMNSTLHLIYNVDLLSGNFAAILNCKKSIDGTEFNSVILETNGNLAYQIPLTSTNYFSIYNGIFNLINRQINFSDFQFGYDKTGTLSGNTGILSNRIAYIIILREIHSLPPNYQHYIGYPYFGYVYLNLCKGFTKCLSVHVENVIGTPEEMEEIERLLKEGVIF